MTQADNVGKKIKDYFKEKGITQVVAAEMLGSTQQVVGRLLNGKPFGKRTAANWSKVFGFNAAWLTTGYGAMFEADMEDVESTTKKVVFEGSEIVANEILKLISEGKLYPASVVKEKDELLYKKDLEIQKLNREIGALRSQLQQYFSSTLNEKTGAAV